jgi:hypothetical protein
MNSLRVEVRDLMVEIHLVSLELASSYVRQMDDPEIERRFQMYTGTELSAAGPTTESRGVSGRFSSGDDDGRPAALNRVPTRNQ